MLVPHRIDEVKRLVKQQKHTLDVIANVVPIATLQADAALLESVYRHIYKRLPPSGSDGATDSSSTTTSTASITDGASAAMTGQSSAPTQSLVKKEEEVPPITMSEFLRVCEKGLFFERSLKLQMQMRTFEKSWLPFDSEVGMMSGLFPTKPQTGSGSPAKRAGTGGGSRPLSQHAATSSNLSGLSTSKENSRPGTSTVQSMMELPSKSSSRDSSRPPTTKSNKSDK